MYRCESCRQAVAPGVKQHRRVVATAPIRYPKREDAHRRKVKKKQKWFDDPGGRGTRIVRELKVCPHCR